MNLNYDCGQGHWHSYVAGKPLSCNQNSYVGNIESNPEEELSIESYQSETDKFLEQLKAMGATNIVCTTNRQGDVTISYCLKGILYSKTIKEDQDEHTGDTVIVKPESPIKILEEQPEERPLCIVQLESPKVQPKVDSGIYSPDAHVWRQPTPIYKLG